MDEKLFISIILIHTIYKFHFTKNQNKQPAKTPGLLDRSALAGCFSLLYDLYLFFI